MGRIVNSSSKTKKSQVSSSSATITDTDRGPGSRGSRIQGVPVHLKKATDQNTAGHTASCNETIREQTSVIAKINSGVLDQGRALDSATQQQMTGQVDQDLSNVKLHIDPNAATLAESVNANAFTYGKDVVFNEGQYQPNTKAGKELLAHELAHVAQQGDAKRLQRQLKSQATPTTQSKKDVVVIVGRPSMTTARNETAEQREQMKAWRSAARALSPHVFEGLRVNKAFVGLKKFRHPIGKLYIVGHADSSGVGEVARDGSTVSTTVADLTKRMRKATGALGSRKPDSIEMLSCYGGGSPKTMGKIASTLGASTIRAPVQTTVISGQIIKLNGKALTKRQIARSSDKTLEGYIKQTTALKYYDYVPGVPHPKTPPSTSDKMTALIKVLRTTGMIPYVGYNSVPGKRDAVPYWKASVEQRKATDTLSTSDELRLKGLIEVQLGTTTKP